MRACVAPAAVGTCARAESHPAARPATQGAAHRRAQHQHAVHGHAAAAGWWQRRRLAAAAAAAEGAPGSSSDVDEDWIEVGRIGPPHGVRGEMKVQPLTDFPEDRLGTPGPRWVLQGWGAGRAWGLPSGIGRRAAAAVPVVECKAVRRDLPQHPTADHSRHEPQTIPASATPAARRWLQAPAPKIGRRRAAPPEEVSLEWGRSMISKGNEVRARPSGQPVGTCQLAGAGCRTAAMSRAARVPCLALAPHLACHPAPVSQPPADGCAPIHPPSTTAGLAGEAGGGGEPGGGGAAARPLAAHPRLGAAGAGGRGRVLRAGGCWGGAWLDGCCWAGGWQLVLLGEDEFYVQVGAVGAGLW